jgi:general secretion pathway protein I
VRGFTLLEVMVALAIIAGVLVTVLTSFGYHLDLARSDKEESIAMLLGRARLDESRMRGERTGSGTFAPAWPEYAWELATEPAPWPGVERLNLTVTWGGKKNHLQLALYREKSS